MLFDSAGSELEADTYGHEVAVVTIDDLELLLSEGSPSVVDVPASTSTYVDEQLVVAPVVSSIIVAVVIVTNTSERIELELLMNLEWEEVVNVDISSIHGVVRSWEIERSTWGNLDLVTNTEGNAGTETEVATEIQLSVDRLELCRSGDSHHAKDEGEKQFFHNR